MQRVRVHCQMVIGVIALSLFLDKSMHWYCWLLIVFIVYRNAVDSETSFSTIW